MSDTLINFGNLRAFKQELEQKMDLDIAAITKVNEHTGNAEIHVTAAEKTIWDGKATILEAAQAFSNPNLLINPDFKVNQYGFTSMVIKGTTHFIDRWYAARAAVAITDNGINLAWNGVDASNGWIQQQIENDSLFGKSVAVSGEIDGTRYCAITEIPVSANTSNNIRITDKIFFVVGNVNNKTISFSVISNSTTPAEIGKLKLELGGYATPFVPPDPATELIKCQRYYQKIKMPINMAVPVTQFPADLHIVAFHINMAEKRTNNYSAAFSGESARAVMGNGSVYPIIEWRVHSKTTNGIGAHAVLANPTPSACFGWIDSFTIEIDAEL